MSARVSRCISGTAALAMPILLAHAAAAVAPSLYHSPNDDGASGGVPATVSSGGPVALHLYLGVGSTPSTANPCHQGNGQELCGFLLRLAGTGMSLQSFTPADGDTLYNLSATELQLTGGDFQTGELGPTKIGDLVINGPAPGGTLVLQAGDFVTSTLAKEQAATPATIVALPEPQGAVPLLMGIALLHRLRALRKETAR